MAINIYVILKAIEEFREDITSNVSEFKSDMKEVKKNGI